jgi:hypothetical protein
MNLIGLLGLGMLAFSLDARADEPLTNIDYLALSRAKAGSWAEYAMTFKAKRETKTMRYVLIDRSARALVLENEITMSIGPTVLRFEYEALGDDAWQIKSGTFRLPDGKTTPIAASQVGATTLVRKGILPGRLIGKDKVRTSAGTFRCNHYSKRAVMGHDPVDVEFWISDQVAPIGLVKARVISKNLDVVLTARGESGARPAR